ncbi:Late embryogenesis abundant protein LEA-2 subgroup domain-containing protein [Dioscorea alata]|uniref:Late embryogenesis abundant protein LEA-2 subgroup domain-containing protein n=1 Tax=Dioscorea alata TaxID=55571 RepID=A0ACB7U7M2_DIOAL|nr:Late embryogenesis abundant protein LEA-2 subgroup domain-containing protein [Dioscorea alata]
MAEWVPPTASASRPPLPQPPPDLPTKPLSEPEPPFRSETYIVQVPKEQIYRIPPPENAYLAEQYKNNLNRRRKSPCLTYLPWLLAVIAAVGITIAIVALVFYLVVRPSVPEVSIEAFAAKNLNHNSRWEKPKYDISMKTLNPSANMGYIYGSGGKASMSHKGVVIASGEPPRFDQPSHNETAFHLVLRGSSNKLPKEIQRSLKGPKEIVTLSLSVNYVVRLKIGVIELSKSMSIQCDFRVSKFAKGTKIVSQECSVELGQ